MSTYRDEQIRYLEMLQRAVDRMVGESASMKQYCLVAVAAIAATASAIGSALLALAGCLLVLIFCYMDAMYLMQERWFRRMYERAREASAEAPASFAMTPRDDIRNAGTIAETMFGGWSTRSLHGALIVILLVLALTLLGS